MRPFIPAVIALSMLGLSNVTIADPVPKGGVGENMKVVGFSNLGGHRGAFKMALNQAKNDRWYLYMGHSFDLGWSILDVTTPENPRYVKFIPYDSPNKGWVTSQITVHDNLMITAVDHSRAGGEGLGAIFWDVSDPENPKQIATWTGGNGGTHRNNYPGGKYAFLSASYPGFRGRVLLIMDVSDPAHPKEVGKWWQPGQKIGEPAPALPSVLYGPATSYHGPANLSPDGKMVSIGYSPEVVNLDISDPANPKVIGRLNMVPPFPNNSAQGVHSVLPLWERNLLYVSSEAMVENCRDAGVTGAAFIDNSDPTKPHLISFFPTPQPPKGAPYKSFCDKGGRFGPHNTNQEIHNPAVAKPTDMMFISWFNAGVRAFDISDPYSPKEVGYFIPPERHDLPVGDGVHDSPINWTEEVAVDTRGYVYINENKWGTWILKYTGKKPGPIMPVKRGSGEDHGGD